MSDTDTDDTDLLLLIPPDFDFCAEAKMSAGAAAADALAMPPPPAPTSAAYQFLHPSKKSELNHINARLQNIGLDAEEPPSDISTISTNTVRNTAAGWPSRELHGMVHSTPKSGSLVEPLRQRPLEDNILLEIDHYLDENNAHRWRQRQDHHLHHHSDDHLRNERLTQEGHAATTSLPSMRLASSSSGAPSVEPARGARNSLNENKLISLSDLWGKSSMARTVLDNNSPNRLLCSPSLKEEQLRRQHLKVIAQRHFSTGPWPIQDNCLGLGYKEAIRRSINRRVGGWRLCLRDVQAVQCRVDGPVLQALSESTAVVGLKKRICFSNQI